MRPKTVGVVGLGSVGWATIHGLSQHYRYSTYDIVGNYSWNNILRTDIIFICVSTPQNTNGRLDCSAVDTVLDRLAKADYQGCVVIKSTLAIGFMAEATENYPQLRLVYMPEFLRELSAFTWFIKPDRLVISGSDTDMNETLSYFSWIDDIVPRLKMSYKSAEVGKLAHNAYIATKISFTNEMELVSSECGADPMDVMQIIWADRRVNSAAHLTPNLGAYGGKCVPKDTLELLNSGESRKLLKAVVAVNENTPHITVQPDNNQIITIIATHDRPDYLERALSSVVTQRRRPDKVYVIIDKEDVSYPEVKDIINNYQKKIPMILLQNTHSQNLSGAINSALDMARTEYSDPNSVFVSILDDDDWWDISYLFNISRYANETGVDWIISGLIRHDNSNKDGFHQEIPTHLTKNMFYVTCPNIQGSNLFVKLSNLLEIGGFDEKLVSTTDRDVCIRLINAGTTYDVLFNHLVHHDADASHSRLSDPGSPRKISGLKYFYKKYSNIMQEGERDAFKRRAYSLFDVTIEEET